jgi:hypothetical protein
MLLYNNISSQIVYKIMRFKDLAKTKYLLSNYVNEAPDLKKFSQQKSFFVTNLVALKRAVG